MSDLDSPAAQRCQQREWLAERIGWGVIFLVLVMAAVGALGPSPVTRIVRTSASGGLTVELHRIVRSDAPANLTIRLQSPPGLVSRPAVIALSRGFLDHTKRDSVNPAPLSIRQQADERIAWEFAHPAAGEALQVKVDYQFVSPGVYETEVTAAGETVTLSQVVLP